MDLNVLIFKRKIIGYLMFEIIFTFVVFVIFILMIFIFNFYQSKSFLNKLFKDFQFNLKSKTKELNPDINTLNWDLHKNRLKRFGRSQYKGLTFFINEQGKIYYLSKEGNKVYC